MKTELNLMLRTKYSEKIEKQMKAFFDSLNEKNRRGYAAIEAMKLGHGGQKYISDVLGCHFQTVMAGIAELTNGTETPEDRIRKPGGGKKKIIDTMENIDEIFFEVLKDNTAGSPMDPRFPPTHNEVGGFTPKSWYSCFCFSSISPTRSDFPGCSKHSMTSSLSNRPGNV